MSEQGNSSAKKFPYLILPNASSPLENIDETYSSRSKDTQTKREASARGHPKNDRQGGAYPGPGFMSYMEDPYQASILSSHTVGHVPFPEFSPQLNTISMTQMKAILTAQKELRKPAGSLYPTASQISLIPETEMIYKRYFPNDGNEIKHEEIVPSKVKMSARDRVGFSVASTKSRDLCDAQLKDKKGDRTTASAAQSVSESNIATVERNKKQSAQVPISNGETVRRMTETPKTPSDKQAAVLRQRDAEARFKKRVQAQLVSLCAEVERQSSDLNDMKKELKELLHMSRKNGTDIDSSKSRLDTLSKHVHEIDNKVDAMQENVCGQEKSLLSKLMLLGEMSDSDSDLEDSGGKGIDALSSPSSTKLAMFSSSNSKRPFSSGSDGLPKSCCNWVPIAPDFDKLLQAVALLNYRMDRNQSMKLCTTNNGATFKHADVTDLTVYKNGIILGSTGFRSYSTMSVIRFVNEIFNGYLPTELSTQYPDGVVIVLTDKRSVIYSCDGNFNGSGTKLSLKDPPDILPGSGINKLQRKESTESVKASTTASLISLPTSSRISSVTNVRKYKMLPELKVMGQCDNHEEKKKPKTIMLKIIVHRNGESYKIRVPVNASIQTVIDHLSSVLAEKDDVRCNTLDISISKPPKSYDMILPVPLGKLSCTTSTLEDYGITQNTLVYLQEQKS